eukprot:CAMPEP_0175173750 /NCGR_PEP_ID=MMETSP0087-20121206/32235_1 /TAXON_ID=136419 /ORGANISM="Unknown Unknown, Strain D1" /LENGTH=117 /DNA_ID=CAMNT_0016465113 /DNA_START=250 /DNA_END=600 /DNA_ORIENTATION=+
MNVFEVLSTPWNISTVSSTADKYSGSDQHSGVSVARSRGLTVHHQRLAPPVGQTQQVTAIADSLITQPSEKQDRAFAWVKPTSTADAAATAAVAIVLVIFALQPPGGQLVGKSAAEW